MKTGKPQSRREFLARATGGSLLFGAAAFPTLRPAPTQNQTVGDKLWIWGSVPGITNDNYGHAPSRMTPAEGATYLGVSNMIVITHSVRRNRPPLAAFDQYALPLRPLKRVVWNVVEAGGRTDRKMVDFVLKMPERHPNIVGFMMDDFYKQDLKRGTLTTDELAELRSRLVIGGSRKDLYVVVYARQLDEPIKPYLEYCDKISFWTWRAENLVNLEKDFRRLEDMAPDHQKLLGCYLWDFGAKRPMPLHTMIRQTEFGLDLLRSGRIEGIIFLGSSVCDLELEAVEWTREWIAEVRDEIL